MTLLRIRYGLPYCELPDVTPGELNRLLSFLLLQGKERPSVVFPRRQGRERNDGLCCLQRLGRMERWALAHSLSSIKRNLPAGCRAHTPSSRPQWESNATSQHPPSSPEYLDHVRRVSARLFKAGWDRTYENFVSSHVPNPTSRLPLKSRADWLWAGRREEFLDYALHKDGSAPVFMARYKEVQSAGKKRPLLIFDERCDLLAPLHRLMYSHISRQDWVLTGPPTPKRMTSVLTNEYQTSVDLVSATDGLSHDVAQAIFDVAFFSSLKIPRTVRLLARQSLSPWFVGTDGWTTKVRHGQMMGSYLSFPLLCIQSYCAALWAARFDRSATFLVNGDDCVISASRGITVQDYPFGFRLNSDKTIVARNVAEVNSTAFLRTGERWREVRHLRRGGAPTDYPGLLHMAEACANAGPGFVDAFSRSRIGKRWCFLPSQLGHKTYPSWKREMGIIRASSRLRRFSELPRDSKPQCEDGLRRLPGEPTTEEQEALRELLWTEGRRGGLKRDVFSPSCGKIRRGYPYGVNPQKIFLSFVGWRGCGHASRAKKPPFFFVPESFETQSERLGLWKAELFRRSFDRAVVSQLDRVWSFSQTKEGCVVGGVPL